MYVHIYVYVYTSLSPYIYIYIYIYILGSFWIQCGLIWANICTIRGQIGHTWIHVVPTWDAFGTKLDPFGPNWDPNLDTLVNTHSYNEKINNVNIQ
jgi:hypothetical protein